MVQMGETHMCHQFFNQPPAESFVRPFIAKTYDLRIAPNAVADGVLVEADADGNYVAAQFECGESVRNHLYYMVVRTDTMNWFADRNHFFHPLD
jgi:hypothetical protein